ncbi:MAG: hypothetical protein WAO78_04525 [Roseovarius sp.]
MKSFLIACVVVVGISVGAAFVLNDNFQRDSLEAFTTEGARTTPGTPQNLIEY